MGYSTLMNWSARYRAAFATYRPQLRPLQTNILNALYHAPEQRLTAGMLARSLQCGVPQINHAFGGLGHRIHDLLGGHPEGWADGIYQWFYILAQGEPTPAGYFWNLQPEVASAVEAMGLVVPSPMLPDNAEA